VKHRVTGEEHLYQFRCDSLLEKEFDGFQENGGFAAAACFGYFGIRGMHGKYH
jgi:hypothetical protein